MYQVVNGEQREGTREKTRGWAISAAYITGHNWYADQIHVKKRDDYKRLRNNWWKRMKRLGWKCERVD